MPSAKYIAGPREAPKNLFFSVRAWFLKLTKKVSNKNVSTKLEAGPLKNNFFCSSS